MASRPTMWSVLGALALASGCIESLDPKTIVRGPRILDIVADRPEINPGQSTTLRVVLAGARGTPTFRWFTCVAADSSASAGGISNFQSGGTFEGCFGDASPTLSLGDGATATLLTSARDEAQLQALARRYGNALPPEVLTAIARDVGIAVGVGVEVSVDGASLRGYKRVLVSFNTAHNTNPPSPRVRFGDVWVTAQREAGDGCAPAGGGPVRVRRNETVNLVPDPDESWAEGYRVLTASGQLADRTERGFYSWYATGGNFARGLTQSPTRDNTWTAPAEAGDHTMWVLLRDGRGGTSPCRVSLRVE